jgi:hypothetical protein
MHPSNILQTGNADGNKCIYRKQGVLEETNFPPPPQKKIIIYIKSVESAINVLVQQMLARERVIPSGVTHMYFSFVHLDVTLMLVWGFY